MWLLSDVAAPVSGLASSLARCKQTIIVACRWGCSPVLILYRSFCPAQSKICFLLQQTEMLFCACFALKVHELSLSTRRQSGWSLGFLCLACSPVLLTPEFGVLACLYFRLLPVYSCFTIFVFVC